MVSLREFLGLVLLNVFSNDLDASFLTTVCWRKQPIYQRPGLLEGYGQ